MTRSVPTSLAGVTHDGDLGANFNQGGPVYVACRGCVGANFNRGCPSGVPPCRAPSLRKYKGGGSRGVLGRRELVHHSSPVTGVSL
ncbi:hypothetical protein CDL15_Pgr020691 [Punica granatum]|uniref:Uncharacterized protein n=1 Tax=Punica granatum TaxID=22663 RepID=A0A218W6V3_PUNGR|nr:hypothetical protein CDL15_Pgr020691 [Punica granatum]